MYCIVLNNRDTLTGQSLNCVIEHTASNSLALHLKINPTYCLQKGHSMSNHREIVGSPLGF